jgi:alkaline phosphatase
MATGILTSPSRIATTAGSDQDAVTILELARDAGLRTGIVTTASVTDATPASFVAHVNQRYCQGPRNMRQYLRRLDLEVDCGSDLRANGGRGSISEQIAAAGVDVVLGGGSIHFDQPAEGETVTAVADVAAANGYRLVRTRDELLSLEGVGPVLGLFARDTMPVRWRGVEGAEAGPLERVDGQIVLPRPFDCEPEPRFEGMPSLAEMTRFALERLEGDRGFFLMVESASIDKQSHDRRPCGHIGELEQLDQAVALALDYAAEHPETLVLVTSDHGHAAQIVTVDGGFPGDSYATPGYFALVRTREGALMGINYATSDSPDQEYHTGTQVPLYADGAGAKSLPTFIAQRELFAIMARHLELD